MKIQPGRTPPSGRLLTSIAAILLMVSICGVQPEQPSRTPSQTQGPLPVAYVVDGDTIIVDDGDQEITVRLIGIDTPETKDPDEIVQCFGPEAAAHTSELLNGRQVYLELDPSQDQTDRYGRTLAYVWRDDNTLVNLDLISAGYAREYTYAAAYRYQQQFTAAQTEAQQAERGLWSPALCPQY